MMINTTEMSKHEYVLPVTRRMKLRMNHMYAYVGKFHVLKLNIQIIK